MIKSKQQVQREGYSTVQGQMSSKVPIELKDVFKESEGKRKVVLIKGAPGSGKSTLSLGISREWANGCLLQEYRLVILVRLHEPSVQNAKTIADLLPSHSETMSQEITEVIANSEGSGVLFIFDGWEDLPQTKSAYSTISNIIQGTQLFRSSIVITSSSSATLYSLVSLRVEILGFSMQDLHLFFVASIQDSNAVKTLLQKVEENRLLRSICSLPLNATILAHLVNTEGVELPLTQYDMFNKFVVRLIHRHLKMEHTEVILESLDDLPREFKGKFQDLCKNAYDGIVEDKVIFELSSDNETLGLLQKCESLVSHGESHFYKFPHSLIQEFLAAFHVASQNEAEWTGHLEKLFEQHCSSTVFEFFAAKTKLKGIDEFLKQHAKKSVENTSHLLSLIHGLFVAEDDSLCKLVLCELENKLGLGCFTHSASEAIQLNLADCCCLDYFLTQDEILEVDLSGCCIDDECCEHLFGLRKERKLQVLK